MREDMITDAGFVHGMSKATYPALSSGPELDDLNAKSFQVITDTFDRLVKPTTVKLSQWINEELMLATTDAVYGPHNPMRDVSNCKAWS